MRGPSDRAQVSRRDLAALALGVPLLIAAGAAGQSLSARDRQWKKLEDHARLWRGDGAVEAVHRARAAGLNPFWWSGSYISPDRSRLTLLFGDWHIPGSTVYRASADGVFQSVALS